MRLFKLRSSVWLLLCFCIALWGGLACIEGGNQLPSGATGQAPSQDNEGETSSNKEENQNTIQVPLWFPSDFAIQFPLIPPHSQNSNQGRIPLQNPVDWSEVSNGLGGHNVSDAVRVAIEEQKRQWVQGIRLLDTFPSAVSNSLRGVVSGDIALMNVLYLVPIEPNNPRSRLSAGSNNYLSNQAVPDFKKDIIDYHTDAASIKNVKFSPNREYYIQCVFTLQEGSRNPYRSKCQINSSDLHRNELRQLEFTGRLLDVEMDNQRNVYAVLQEENQREGLNLYYAFYRYQEDRVAVTQSINLPGPFFFSPEHDKFEAALLKTDNKFYLATFYKGQNDWSGTSYHAALFQCNLAADSSLAEQACIRRDILNRGAMPGEAAPPPAFFRQIRFIFESGKLVFFESLLTQDFNRKEFVYHEYPLDPALRRAPQVYRFPYEFAGYYVDYSWIRNPQDENHLFVCGLRSDVAGGSVLQMDCFTLFNGNAQRSFEKFYSNLVRYSIYDENSFKLFPPLSGRSPAVYFIYSFQDFRGAFHDRYATGINANVLEFVTPLSVRPDYYKKAIMMNLKSPF